MTDLRVVEELLRRIDIRAVARLAEELDLDAALAAVSKQDTAHEQADQE